MAWSIKRTTSPDQAGLGARTKAKRIHRISKKTGYGVSSLLRGMKPGCLVNTWK